MMRRRESIVGRESTSAKAAARAWSRRGGDLHEVQVHRDNWLSNRVFKSYDDLVDHCCAAWKNLADQPWRTMSIGLRQWAHGF